MRKIYTFICLVISSVGFCQSLEKDTSFNPFTLPENHNYIDGSCTKCLVQPDGKILVVQYININAGRSVIKRIDVNNLIDPTFSNTLYFDGIIKDMALQADGKIVVVGGFSNVNGTSSRFIVRLNTDGTIDNSFIVAGFGTFSNSPYQFASSLVIRPDGKILVGGALWRYGTAYQNSLFLLNTDGTLDTSFTPSIPEYDVSKMTLLSNGQIILCFQGNAALKKLNADGSIDNSFNFTNQFTNASGNTGIINTVVEEADGKLLVGGRFTKVNNLSYKDFARLNSDGTLNTQYSASGFSVTSYLSDNYVGVSTILIQNDGKIILGGDFIKYQTNNIDSIVRLNPDFTIDTTFVGGIDTQALWQDNYASSSFSCLASHPDGDIIGVGSFHSYNGVAINGVVKINNDGSKESNFNNICRGFDESVKQFELQPDGKILCIGRFHAYNGVFKNRFLRLNADGSLDESFNVSAEPFMNENDIPWDIKLQTDGKIMVASNGRFYYEYNANFPAKGGALVRLNADGSLDPTFNDLSIDNYFRIRGQCLSVAIQADGKILAAGGLYYGNSSSIIYMARFNTDGSLDPSFQYSLNLPVSKIELQQDGKIIAMATANNTTAKIIRLFDTGAIDPSFTLATSLSTFNRSMHISLQPDDTLLLTINSPNTSRYKIAKLNNDGSINTAFNFTPINQHLFSTEDATAVLPNGKILYAVTNVINPAGLLRVNSDGTADSSFNIGTGFGTEYNFSTDKIAVMKVLPDGKILCGGGLRTFQDVSERSIVRLIDTSLANTAFSENTNLMIYPNPSHDILNIPSVDDKSRFKIYNTLGQEVYASKIEDHKVDISNLSAGIYILEVNVNSTIKRQKFLKE